MRESRCYHRRNLWGVRGVRVPPTFWSGGYRTPTFWACDRKNNSHVPSSSAHVSPYNIQENVWRLGLRPRNCVDLHRCIQKNYTCEYIGEYMGLGPRPPTRSEKKLHNRFSCEKGTNIYVKVLRLVIVNVTKYVPQKCQI